MSINFNNTFKDFYYISNNNPQITNSTKIGNATVLVGDIKEDDSISKRKIFGIVGASVTTLALITLVILSFVSKCFSGNIVKKLEKISNKLKDSIYDLTTSQKKLTYLEKIKLRLSKAIQPLTDILQSSSNITAIKDSYIYNVCKKLKLDPTIQKINKLFKGIVLKTKNNAYHTTELSLANFCNLLKKTNNPKLLEQAKKLESEYTNVFSTLSHSSRSEEIWHKMQNLHEDVYETLFANKGLLKDLKKYKTYITTSKIANETKLLQNTLEQAKRTITNGIDDVYILMNSHLNKIKTNINPKHEESVEIIRNIGEKIEKYKKLEKNFSSTKEAAMRKKLLQAIKQELERLKNHAKQNAKTPETVKKLILDINEFSQILEENISQKGLAQEILAELKNIYGKNSTEYQQAYKILKDFNNQLNTAITSEINSYEKLAELRVGSALTDILGIIGPSALATFLIINSDNKNDRISTTLTEGIPILGGIGVSYYGMTRGFTGVKSLVLALTTGFALSIIGKEIDQSYKKYAQKQIEFKKALEMFTKQQKAV